MHLKWIPPAAQSRENGGGDRGRQGADGNIQMEDQGRGGGEVRPKSRAARAPGTGTPLMSHQGTSDPGGLVGFIRGGGSGYNLHA